MVYIILLTIYSRPVKGGLDKSSPYKTKQGGLDESSPYIR